jgi:hypothetical protein
MGTERALVVAAIGLLASTIASAALSPAEVAGIERTCRPSVVTDLFRDDTEHLPDLFDRTPTNALVSWFPEAGEPVGYAELQLSNDAEPLLLLLWSDRSQDTFWRLLRLGGQTYSVVQDSAVLLVRGELEGIHVRVTDLDGDGTNEVVLEGGSPSVVRRLWAYAWRDGGLRLITPLFPDDGTQAGYPLPSVLTAVESESNNVVLDDLDDDGKAEIIAGPSGERYPVNPEQTDWAWRYWEGTRIFKLVDGEYKLWKEVPADDPYPVSLPGIGVVHPGTIPYSELSSSGGGDLRVFVSHPPDSYTVDDYDPASFETTPIRTKVDVKKRWTNQDYPDLSLGNYAWQGCPLRKSPRPAAEEWTVNPSKPAYPSPDEGYELRFLGPYLELRLPRDPVKAFLKNQADQVFAEDAAANKAWVEIPLMAKMKDGKLARIGAIVCVKKTGNAK